MVWHSFFFLRLIPLSVISIHFGSVRFSCLFVISTKFGWPFFTSNGIFMESKSLWSYSVATAAAAATATASAIVYYMWLWKAFRHIHFDHFICFHIDYLLSVPYPSPIAIQVEYKKKKAEQNIFNLKMDYGLWRCYFKYLIHLCSMRYNESLRKVLKIEATNGREWERDNKNLEPTNIITNSSFTQ